MLTAYQFSTSKLNFCFFPFNSGSASIPLIPLGLKETKDVDFSVPFKVRSFHSTYRRPFVLFIYFLLKEGHVSDTAIDAEK